MTEYLKKVPTDWTKILPCSCIPKDGTEYRDSFKLSVTKPVNYWSQFYTPKENIKVEVRGYNSNGGIYLKVIIDTVVSLSCSRCLELADAEVHGELTYLVVHESELEEKREEFDEDMEVTLFPVVSWDEKINLGPLVWETFVTSLPMRVVCSADCKGLCPQCGANLNKSTCNCKESSRDPRFEVLRTLIENEKK